MAHDPVRYEDRMSDGDALMWNIERDPLLRSTIAVVWLMDRRPDRARLERKVERAECREAGFAEVLGVA